VETNPRRPSGFLDSFRALGDGLLALAHDRAALFVLELQEEKFRLIQIMIWISAAVFAGFMALTFASLTLVYIYWESARLAVLGGLAAFYTIALGVIVLALRRLLSRQSPPFAASLQAIGGDHECIRSAN
jgi:uncharacterized membrane protein YqjE